MTVCPLLQVKEGSELRERSGKRSGGFLLVGWCQNVAKREGAAEEIVRVHILNQSGGSAYSVSPKSGLKR